MKVNVSFDNLFTHKASESYVSKPVTLLLPTHKNAILVLLKVDN
jgi:hypothetical protein